MKTNLKAANEELTSFPKDVLDRATKALRLAARIGSLELQMDDHKTYFREFAAGEGQTIPVEGVGKVVIASPGGGVKKEVVEFNYENFLQLDAKTRAKLEAAGVVNKKIIHTPISKAAVKFVLNA